MALDRRGFGGAEVLAAVAPAGNTRPAAELTALRLIRAGLRHPHVTNPLGMAEDVAQALGLIPAKPRAGSTLAIVLADREARLAERRRLDALRCARTSCRHSARSHPAGSCTTSGCGCTGFRPQPSATSTT